MKIILTAFILLFTLNTKSQIIDFIGASSGNLQDTVTFGFSEGCTIGIDDFINEEDLSNIKNDSLELRIFQRNKEHFSCLVDTTGKEIYFENYFQLKKDLRSPSSNGSELYFEVDNLTNNFHDGYLINLRKYHSFNKRSIYLGFSAISECGEDKIEYANPLMPVDSAYLISIVVPPINYSRPDQKDYKYFYFHLKVSETLSINEETNNKNALFYPNPVNNFLIIESNNKIKIYNLSGILILSLNSSEEKRIIDLSLIPSGVYIINTIDHSEKIIARTKFVKW